MNIFQTTELETERLLLRRFTTEDMDAFAKNIGIFPKFGLWRICRAREEQTV